MSFSYIQNVIQKNIHQLNGKKRKEAEKKLSQAYSYDSTYQIFQIWNACPQSVLDCSPVIAESGKNALQSLLDLEDRSIRSGALFQALTDSIAANNSGVLVWLSEHASIDLSAPPDDLFTPRDEASFSYGLSQWHPYDRYDSWFIQAIRKQSLDVALTLAQMGLATESAAYFNEDPAPTSSDGNPTDVPVRAPFDWASFYAPERSPLLAYADELQKIHPILLLFDCSRITQAQIDTFCQAGLGTPKGPVFQAACAQMALNGNAHALRWCKKHKITPLAGGTELLEEAGATALQLCIPQRWNTETSPITITPQAQALAQWTLSAASKDSHATQAFFNGVLLELTDRVCSFFEPHKNINALALQDMSHYLKFVQPLCQGRLFFTEPQACGPDSKTQQACAQRIQNSLLECTSSHKNHLEVRTQALNMIQILVPSGPPSRPRKV